MPERRPDHVSYTFDSKTPIYLQLLEIFRQNIANGNWQPGDRVASVRDLAITYGVNPNTVQRSLSELEREGLAYTERTSGRFITTDIRQISQVRDQLAGQQIQLFLSQMRDLGYDREQLLAMIDEKWSDQHGAD
jgi:GntR family transcriptional regulator